MATWDVFHGNRLEAERNLSTAEVLDAFARGDLVNDDLIRPAGSSAPWVRLAEKLPLLSSPSSPEPEPPPFSNDLDADDQKKGQESSGSVEIVVWDDGLDEPDYDPQEEDEAVAEFTLARGSAATVEELDLAAMVDVAFQLVLFFLVTATTVLYKSLEVPRPNPENAPSAAATQGKSQTLDDLKDDFIVVEIDPTGGVKIDREPVPSEMPALAERLRQARERTGRKAMLLSADFATPHRSAVLAYDAANEIGLGIAIARPTSGPRQAPAPDASEPILAPGSGG
ncbi:MAG: hypothetical protein NVSMB9_07210 [Isosphaeraceae bacterium]